MDDNWAEATHDLLLELAGRVDDDLLAWARELVAVDEARRAVELLTATLAADRVVLPEPIREALVAASRAVRSEVDAAAELAPSGVDGGAAHRFDGGPVDAVADVVRGLPARLLADCRVLLARRLTPAGSAPGPLPHPVVLVEVSAPERSRDVLAYQLADALDRAGVRASVEVITVGVALPDYHAEAMRSARPVRSGDAGASGSSGTRPAGPGSSAGSVPAGSVPAGSVPAGSAVSSGPSPSGWATAENGAAAPSASGSSTGSGPTPVPSGRPADPWPGPARTSTAPGPTTSSGPVTDPSSPAGSPAAPAPGRPTPTSSATGGFPRADSAPRASATDGPPPPRPVPLRAGLRPAGPTARAYVERTDDGPDPRDPAIREAPHEPSVGAGLPAEARGTAAVADETSRDEGGRPVEPVGQLGTAEPTRRPPDRSGGPASGRPVAEVNPTDGTDPIDRPADRDPMGSVHVLARRLDGDPSPDAGREPETTGPRLVTPLERRHRYLIERPDAGGSAWPPDGEDRPTTADDRPDRPTTAVDRPDRPAITAGTGTDGAAAGGRPTDLSGFAGSGGAAARPSEVEPTTGPSSAVTPVSGSAISSGRTSRTQPLAPRPLSPLPGPERLPQRTPAEPRTVGRPLTHPTPVVRATVFDDAAPGAGPRPVSGDPARYDPAQRDPAQREPAQREPAGSGREREPAPSVSAHHDPTRQDPAAPDAAAHELTRQDPAAHDPAAHDRAAYDPVAYDPVAHDWAQNDRAQKDRAQKDRAQKDRAQNDPGEHDPGEHDPGRRDPARPDSAASGPTRNEATRHPAASTSDPRVPPIGGILSGMEPLPADLLPPESVARLSPSGQQLFARLQAEMRGAPDGGVGGLTANGGGNGKATGPQARVDPPDLAG